MTIETSGNALHVRGAGSHFQIVTQAVSDFPPVPGLDVEPDFTIDDGLLRKLIEWTVFASAKESTRYAINGVLCEIAGKDLVLAATDGRRLSVARSKLSSSNVKSLPKAIVPGKALLLFNRLPAEPETVVAAKVTANQIILRMGRAVVSSILVEGHFPKYQDVIPGDCDRIVEIDTAEFLSALKRAALLTNEESKGVRLAFSDGALTLSSRAPEQGEATISMPVRYRGEAIEIGFNPVFLTDVLRVAHSDVVTFAFREPNRPGVIRIGDQFTHVVMPVNLASA
jgi:DNA polymerase-3 subunit beta